MAHKAGNKKGLNAANFTRAGSKEAKDLKVIKKPSGIRNLIHTLPVRNHLPYPRISLEIRRKGKSHSLHFGGELAGVIQELLVKGGTSSQTTRIANLHGLIRHLQRFYGLRIRIRRTQWYGQTVTRYWLMEKVKAFVGVRHD